MSTKQIRKKEEVKKKGGDYGKGSRSRVSNFDAYRTNYDVIFGKKKVKKKVAEK